MSFERLWSCKYDEYGRDRLRIHFEKKNVHYRAFLQNLQINTQSDDEIFIIFTRE